MVDAAITKSRRAAIAQNVVFGRSRRKYSDEYYTPPEIPAALGPFDLDPSAGPSRHARRNIRRPKNGLAANWEGRVWMNPPYSDIEDWVDAFRRHRNGIALVNARHETRWFQELASGASAMLWLRGRIKFNRPNGEPVENAHIGSVLVAYGRRNAQALERSGLPGIITYPARPAHARTRKRA